MSPGHFAKVWEEFKAHLRRSLTEQEGLRLDHLADELDALIERCGSDAEFREASRDVLEAIKESRR